MKRFAIGCLALLLLAGCSSAKGGGGYGNSTAPAPAAAPQYSTSADNAGGMYEMNEANYDSMVSESAMFDEAAGRYSYEENLKIIRDANLTIETDDFWNAAQSVRAAATVNGGFVQYSATDSYTGRFGKRYNRANFTLRVPSDAFDRAMDALKNVGKATSVHTGSEDVTAQYTDIQSRLKVKEAEEGRLLDMLSKTTDVYGLIQLEQHLANVRTDIELYKSRLQNIDRLADYATISVSLQEQGTDAPANTFPERIAKAFRASIDAIVFCGQAVVLLFAAAIVPLLLLAAIGGATVGIVKLARRRERP